MDLSFHRSRGLRPAHVRPVDRSRVPAWPFLRAVSAATQAASPTAKAVASVLRGRDGPEDWVEELAGIFAPRSGGVIDAACLAGSFNPLIAGHSRWGKDDENGVYRGALADVQGWGG